MNVVGSRLTLRLLSPEDVTPEYVAWMNDNEITRFLESRWRAQTPETVRDFVRAMNDSANDFLFGIFTNDTGKHIGNIKIGSLHPLHRRADVGLLLGDKNSWGKGYATEAIQLVTRYGFEELNLHKLFAGMYAANQGSYKAFLKAGYREVGRLEQHCFFNGDYMDEILVERRKNAP